MGNKQINESLNEQSNPYFQMGDNGFSISQPKQEQNNLINKKIFCIPNLNCLDQTNRKQNKWQMHMKYIIKTQYICYDWAKQIEQKLNERANMAADQINLNLLQTIARNSLITAELNLEKSNLSLMQLDKLIDETLQNTEILTETLQEFRYSPQNSLFGKKVQALSSSELYEKIKDIYIYAYQYKSITNCLNEQILDSQHPLFVMNIEFCEYFLNKYDKVNPTPLTIQKIVDEIKIFVSFYLEIMRQYFNLDQLITVTNQKEAEKFLNIENFTNFIYGNLFQNSTFYTLVLSFFMKLDYPLQESFSKTLKLLKFQQPEDLGISSEFSLNQNTLELIMQNTQKIQERFNLPYKKVFTIFKDITTIKSPIQKLKLIINTSELLKDCINEFYEAYESKDKAPFLDADHLLSLYIYLIMKGEIDHIYAHCKIIERFVQRNTNNSVSGYLLITLEGCVHHLAQYQKKILNKQISE